MVVAWVAALIMGAVAGFQSLKSDRNAAANVSERNQASEARVSKRSVTASIPSLPQKREFMVQHLTPTAYPDIRAFTIVAAPEDWAFLTAIWMDSHLRGNDKGGRGMVRWENHDFPDPLIRNSG